MNKRKDTHKKPPGGKKKQEVVGLEYTIIGGRQPVLEALRGTQILLQKVYVQESAHGRVIEEIKQAASERNVPLKHVSRDELDQKAEEQIHQGVVALTRPYRYLKIEELLELAHRSGLPGSHPFLLILDHLQDPHNFGSLLRSASCFGVGGVIIPSDRACGVTPAVFKASAGALAHVPVARAVNLHREVERLKKEGYWIMGAEMGENTPYDQVDFALPLALVLGSEGQGLSRLLREKCDVLLHIPMLGPLLSLNVSVAGGILMSQVFKQRSKQS